MAALRSFLKRLAPACGVLMLLSVIQPEAFGQSTVPNPIPKEAPPLAPPPGNVVWVRNQSQLRPALERAANGATVMIAEGTYDVHPPIVMRDRRNVVIRGETNDPSKVVLKGRGWDSRRSDDTAIQIFGGENITIANMTFTEFYQYGVMVLSQTRPKDVHIYNCHFRDIGVRGIKGSGSDDADARAVGGSVRFCQFENTKIPSANWQDGGNYITAIDMMILDGWVFSDNYFKDIKGRTGTGRGAIFVWVRSRNITVERNVFINCDRGIAFGNPSGSTTFVEGVPHITDGIIRNNFIVPGASVAVELWWVDGAKVHHNTIAHSDSVRFGISGGRGDWPNKRVEIVNNLVAGRIDVSGEVDARSNYSGNTSRYFVDPENGDLRLTGAARGAIDRGVPLEDVTDDFFGLPRDTAPDMGASEFGAVPAQPVTRERETRGPVLVLPPVRPRRQTTEEAVQVWDARLVARTREAIAAGSRPSVRIFQQPMQVMAVDAERNLDLSGRGARMEMEWARLGVPERRSLAQSLLREGTPADHALVAFYFLLENNENAAREHLLKSRELADEVQESFRAPGEESQQEPPATL